MYERVSEKFGLTSEDAKEWYKSVQITASCGISASALSRTINILYQAKVISSTDFPLQNLIASSIAELETDIHAVRLYNKPELVKYLRNNLIANNMASGPLKYTDLLPYDQHHYHGVEILDLCAQLINLNQNSKIINIGSSLGGPARYFAGKIGAQVLAIELQEELYRVSVELTERCNLYNLVHHISGDFLQVAQHLKDNSYDSIVSWLTVLHIPKREELFKLAFNLLKPGGYFFAEDFYKFSALTPEESKILAEEVYCPYCPDSNTYKAQLKGAGFEIISFTDLTDDWKAYTAQRVQMWESDKTALEAIHREDTYSRLLSFYTRIRDIFSGGNLGGARIIARKPLN